ncbi:HD domain-containing phosphohydrolase [Guyparkeria sp. 1SP6A2]|nr:HD domain-containing phosphohydrolase [Guyparkeria sp. 1SP6A2]
MHSYRRKAAILIALVSTLLAIAASTAAWFVAQENAEHATVQLAMEESRRMIGQFDLADLNGPDGKTIATQAARTLAGGLFEIAEVYDQDGTLLAEWSTPAGERLEPQLDEHGSVLSQEPDYQALHLPDDRWVLRVTVPLFEESASTDAPIAYFEGVRLVPDWQRQSMLDTTIAAALMAALAAIACGLVIYPIVVHLNNENDRKSRDLLSSHIALLEAMGKAVAKRDSDTGDHNYRVTDIAMAIGERLGLAKKAMRALLSGALLHDVGKIGIPDRILLKPGRLDDQEMALMRSHVPQGEDIVDGIPSLAEARDVIACHHEKWDGSGYPRGLAGEDIPLSARIFAVADVFDALCSLRPYKEAMPFEQAWGIIRDDAGSHFDPRVVEAFRPIARKLHQQHFGKDRSRSRQVLERGIGKYFF